MGVFMTAVAALYHEARDRLTRAERDARVADALREQLAAEDQHRAFFENIQELVVIYQAVRDERGNVTDWVVRDTNARTREHLESLLRSMGRLPPGEPFVGLRVSAMSGPEQAALLAERWAGAIAGTPLTYERSFGGREYSVTAFAMGADVVATLAFDITDRKRAEETLRESDRRKSEFLAVLSHELRNPLVPIRNFIYVLDRAAPDGAVAARARQGIKRQTEHLTQLVDDLLDVTRISRGRIELHRSRIDLREIVRGTAEDLRSSFEETGVALRIDQAPGPVWIEADQTRIAQVLWNLLHNALKFTPDAGIVTVDVGDDDGCAEISVRDTGVGMPPEDVRSMFEPFAQAERSLARTQGGLGLGLALVKGLVELHGGSVRARSEGPGLGAEFTVRLPLADPEGASAGAP
jgi:signal transduction histidine kinase